MCSPLGVVTKKVPEFIIYLSELLIVLNYGLCRCCTLDKFNTASEKVAKTQLTISHSRWQLLINNAALLISLQIFESANPWALIRRN